MSADPPDDLVDRLYGLPIDAFVPERDAAAKALRKEKRREEATAVGGLRKPSVAAWLVNRLEREEREAMDALLAAGEALRAAQDEAVAGRGGDELRAAGQREQEAVGELVPSARGLEPGGKAPSDDVLERVRVTLHAAAGDPAVRADVDAGRLTREVEGGGAWPFMADAPDPPQPAPKPARRARSVGKRTADEEDDGTDEAEREAAERQAEVEREEAERERRRQLEAAQKEAKAHRRERERAERRAEAAEENASAAAAAAETAAAELDEARAAEAQAVARVAELGG